MKKNLFFAVAIMAAMLFTSCITVCHDPENPLDRPGQVSFTGTVGGTATRVSGTQWTPGDAIGVFALTAPVLDGNDIFEGATNRRFTTSTATGHFLPATESDIIRFPVAGTTLHFVAYYPHSTAVTGAFGLPINVTTQHPQRSIDVLRAVGTGTNTASNVTLPFQRQMSQVIINVTASDVLTLDGLVVSIEGLARQGTLNLVNSTMTSLTNTGAIQTIVTPGATALAATSTSILFPTQDFGDAIVRFTLGTYEWIWDDIDTQTLGAGYSHAYTVHLSGTSRSAVQSSNATITPWQPGVGGDGGTIHRDPNLGIVGGLTTVSFDETGGTIPISVTADVGLAWTATAQPGQNWLRTLSGGTGDGTFTIEADPNTGGPRTATVTVTAAGVRQPIIITVTQDKDPAAIQSLVFNETFGTPASGVNTLIANYTGWVTTTDFNSQASVTFVGTITGAGGQVDVRLGTGVASSSGHYPGASGGGNVLFSATNGGTLWINNIYVCGTRNLLLSFGTNQSSAIVSVAYSYSDGVTSSNWYSIPFTKTIPDGVTSEWGLVGPLPIHLPSGTTNVSLRFTALPVSFGARIDDVTIITYDTPNGGC